MTGRILSKPERYAVVYDWTRNHDLSETDRALVRRFLATGDASWLKDTQYERAARLYVEPAPHLDSELGP